MIVATAGHIDHGKTVLVKALTGVDTDRLPEEKARGMSIDLGFAYAPLAGDEVVGFVDVPGHERFVRNMVAGVTGIDHALLVIAADDGPMPQTREHLAILDLLGVPGGAVALTKTDRVDAGRLAQVSADVAGLLHGTIFEDAPVFPVAAPLGQGIDALADHLSAIAAGLRARRAAGAFRLAVDRVFVLRGAGLVVTGTVFSGRVAIDDSLTISPSGLTVRVRGIHAQNVQAASGGVGERLALNIAGAGVSRDKVGRGDWLVAPHLHAPTDRIDVRLRVLPGEASPLRHGAAVHVHIGAADVTGRVALLADRQIAPGAVGLAQLVLDAPVACLGGDRFILRDRAAQRTLAGGMVLDPQAPARGRRRTDRLAVLAALEQRAPAAALASLLEASADGVDLDWFARVRNLGQDGAEDLIPRADMVWLRRTGLSRAFAPGRWAVIEAAVLRAVAEPPPDADTRGVAEGTLRRAVQPALPRAVADLVLEHLSSAGRIVRSGGLVRLPGATVSLSKTDAKLWDAVRPLLEAGGTVPPRVRELAEAVNLSPEQTERFLARMGAAGLVRRVSRNRFFQPEALRALAAIAEAAAAESPEGTFDARAFRDRSGIGRNLTIEVLEYFDSQGFTRRIGDARRITRTAAQVFGGDDAG